MKTAQEIKDEAFRAYRHGKDVSANPYSSSHIDHDIWNAAFRHAQQAHNLKEAA